MMHEMAEIDLLLATVDRTDEVARLMASIRGQSFHDVRLIVVDQNDDARLDAILSLYQSELSLVRLRSRPGLSRARNLGLRMIGGEIVAFPDDDCWYPSSLLGQVAAFFRTHPEWDGLSVCSTDDSGRPSNVRWDRMAGPVDRFNVWRRASSISMFLRRSVIEAVGGFDEELGAGAGTPWASGEETDYFLRALEAGFSLWYEPSLSVGHESPRPSFSRQDSSGAYFSGLGQGRVLRRHDYPRWFVAHRVVQLVAGSAMFFLTGRAAKARFYFAMARGRLRGWLRARSTA